MLEFDSGLLSKLSQTSQKQGELRAEAGTQGELEGLINGRI